MISPSDLNFAVGFSVEKKRNFIRFFFRVAEALADEEAVMTEVGEEAGEGRWRLRRRRRWRKR